MKDTIDQKPQSTNSFSDFFHTESAGGIMLILSTVIAMIWANSPWSETYFAIWETKLTLALGDFGISKPLSLWINDGLMAVFFFLVGLEIKREVMAGELSSFRKASLPFFAAVGGMVIPVAVFFLFHGSNPGRDAWGITMATDIAFSLGILTLLGSRVPLGLKVFLTAFAIVDDIGAVIVIALVYSESIILPPLGIAAVLLVLLMVLNLINVRATWLYLVVGVVVWYFFLKSGLHPTVAGVLVAFTIPVRNLLGVQLFLGRFQQAASKVADRLAVPGSDPFFPKDDIHLLEKIQADITRVKPPLQRLESRLHGFIAFFVMPLFALANAGVDLYGKNIDLFSGLSLSIVAGLVLGKTLGIFSFSWLSIRSGLANMPEGVNWSLLLGAGMLGGIGFTMSLFITELALTEGPLIDDAKIGILLASLVAGVAGYFYLRRTLMKNY